MADLLPQFEQVDLSGSTMHHVGTVGTTPISLPNVAADPIAEVLFNTQAITSQNGQLLFSFDGGATWSTLKRNTILGWAPRGPIYQVQIKGNQAGVEYDIILNHESA